MPRAEVELSRAAVEKLIYEQYPQLADEEITAMGHGWDNFLFRVGGAHIARFPRRRIAVDLVRHESRWLPALAPDLSLPVPSPVFLGEPGEGYPWPWTIVPFIEGDPAGETRFHAERTAESLGAFLALLHRPAPDDAPRNPYRGMHITERDASTRDRIASLSSDLGDDRLLPIWERLCGTDRWRGPPLWLHGDLHPQNVLIVEGAPSGVIDFGDITAGDPATDLSVGWMLFDAGSRGHFLDAYGGVDHQTYDRSRAWALSLAVSYVAGGADSEVMTRIGVSALERIAVDL